MGRKHTDELPAELNWPLNIESATVLMVEDNPDHVDLALSAMETYGFMSIDVAGTMATAFEMMKAKTYQVLLVDYCLPDGYGIDLLDWVDDRCTVVMMTAQGNEKVAVEAFKRGVLDYVVKDSLFRETLPEIVEQAMAKNEYIRRTSSASQDDSLNNHKSAIAYSQSMPQLNGYIHVQHLRTSFAKLRRHLAEIRGCLRVVRYNPDEPVTENQLGFLESALDNCELLEDILTRMFLKIEDKSEV